MKFIAEVATAQFCVEYPKHRATVVGKRDVYRNLLIWCPISRYCRRLFEQINIHGVRILSAVAIPMLISSTSPICSVIGRNGSRAANLHCYGTAGGADAQVSDKWQAAPPYWSSRPVLRPGRQHDARKLRVRRAIATPTRDRYQRNKERALQRQRRRTEHEHVAELERT